MLILLLTSVALIAGENDANGTGNELSAAGRRNYGVELNPIMLLMSKKDFTNIFATFSIFNLDRGAEIAFPVYYGANGEDAEKSTVLILDAQYRKFFNTNQKGFYFCGGLRYSFEKGYEDIFIWPYPDEEDIVTNNKLGLSFGIGYRYFSESGLFWGINLSGGRYLTSTKTKIYNSSAMYWTPDYFGNFELLKFGYYF